MPRYQLNYLSTDYVDYFQGCSQPYIGLAIEEQPTIASVTDAIYVNFNQQIDDRIPEEGTLSKRQCKLIAPTVLRIWKDWLSDESNRKKFSTPYADIPFTFLSVVPMQRRIRL